jgi:hypothetical protein
LDSHRQLVFPYPRLIYDSGETPILELIWGRTSRRWCWCTVTVRVTASHIKNPGEMEDLNNASQTRGLNRPRGNSLTINLKKSKMVVFRKGGNIGKTERDSIGEGR